MAVRGGWEGRGAEGSVPLPPSDAGALQFFIDGKDSPSRCQSKPAGVG